MQSFLNSLIITYQYSEIIKCYLGDQSHLIWILLRLLLILFGHVMYTLFTLGSGKQSASIHLLLLPFSVEGQGQKAKNLPKYTQSFCYYDLL